MTPTKKELHVHELEDTGISYLIEAEGIGSVEIRFWDINTKPAAQKALYDLVNRIKKYTMRVEGGKD